jgi:hypothetical protein
MLYYINKIFYSFYDTILNIIHLESNLFNDIMDEIMNSESNIGIENSINTDTTLENQEPIITKNTEEELQSIETIRNRLKNIKSDIEIEFKNKKNDDTNINCKRRFSDISKESNSNNNSNKDETHSLKDNQNIRYGHYHTDIFLDDLYDDADEMLYQTLQYIKNYNYCGKIQSLIHSLSQLIKTNIIIAVMFIIWLYSWAIYQATKIIELGLRKLLLLPDNMFSFVYWTSKEPKINTNKYVQILSAFNEHGNITNKFKLFLHSYFDSSNEIHDIPGFDMNHFIKLFNCTLLYCSYLLKDSANLDTEIQEQKKRFLISRQESRSKVQRYKKSEFISEQTNNTSDNKSANDNTTQENKPLINNTYLNSILHFDVLKNDGPSDIILKESNVLLSHCTFE